MTLLLGKVGLANLNLQRWEWDGTPLKDLLSTKGSHNPVAHTGRSRTSYRFLKSMLKDEETAIPLKSLGHLLLTQWDFSNTLKWTLNLRTKKKYCLCLTKYVNNLTDFNPGHLNLSHVIFLRLCMARPVLLYQQGNSHLHAFLNLDLNQYLQITELLPTLSLKPNYYWDTLSL